MTHSRCALLPPAATDAPPADLFDEIAEVRARHALLCAALRSLRGGGVAQWVPAQDVRFNIELSVFPSFPHSPQYKKCACAGVLRGARGHPLTARARPRTQTRLVPRHRAAAGALRAHGSVRFARALTARTLQVTRDDFAFIRVLGAGGFGKACSAPPAPRSGH
jgi:hypothetical protein